MWRNYLTVGVRALMKNRTYALINILGLAIGMAACLLILLYVRYEFSYDRTLPNVENSYQLQSHYVSSATGERNLLQMTSYVAGARFRKDFPQVGQLVYALGGAPTVLQDGMATPVEDVLMVDGPLFDVLRFPFARGNPRTALARPGSAVLTEKEALKRYGTTDVLGRTLTMVSRGTATDYRITGIVRDPPKNSGIRLSIVARVDMAAFFHDLPAFLDSWGWQSGWVFFTLKPGTDPAAIQAQMPAWEKRNIPDENIGGIRSNAGDDQDWNIANIRDIHLGEAQNGAMTPGNDARSVYTFAIIALLILGMACVNFTNLATARASQRAREVALRKVLGANRRQLILQFLGESILIAAIAMLVALALVELLLPAFAAFLDADLGLAYFGREGIALPMVLLVLLVGVAGGLYPAFILSGFEPARVLKANKSAAKTRGSGRLRSVLVVGQFAISIGLIVCTTVIYTQTLYARSVDPGFKREGILQVDNFGRVRDETQRRTLVDEIRRLPGVEGAAGTGIGINTGSTSTRGFQIAGRSDLLEAGTYAIQPDFFDTMGIDLVAGRKLDERQMDDATLPRRQDDAAARALAARGMNAVINELAVKRFGFRDAQSAIGKVVRTTTSNASDVPLTPITIVGVVRDSRFRSVRKPIEAILFFRDDNGLDVLDVRYSGDPQAVRGRIEALWKRMLPDVLFEAQFGSDIVQRLYRAEDARAQTFAGFAALAVIVACLGLFGLAAFTAERRTKEIGVRKVLGARTRDIVRLLVWQFSKPVVIANLIAWPVAWWVMRDWLNGFDARISLGPVPFVAAGALALLIAIATIGAHAYRVARQNPVNALRYE